MPANDLTFSTVRSEKLDSVNRLLLDLQLQRGNHLENSNSNGNGNNSGSLLSAKTTTATATATATTTTTTTATATATTTTTTSLCGDDGESPPPPHASEPGIFVIADRDLEAGTCILECTAEGFVPEGPEHRSRYCSYCCVHSSSSSSSSSNNNNNNTDSGLEFCPHCTDCDGIPMVGHCSDTGCADLHKRHHVDNPRECSVLRCLVASLTPTATATATATGEEGGQKQPLSEEQDLTNRVIRAIFGSSVALLALRLVCRQQEENGGSSDPLRLLHERPLDGPWESIAAVLASALDAVEVCTATVRGNNNHHHEVVVRSTLGRILGCSHAIVDPSLPLGRQSLGRAIYAGHSFYNHSCAPNAYLSSALSIVSSSSSSLSSSLSSSSSSSSQARRRAPTARVHLLRPVRTGDEITLSYLPLSGLSTQERQRKLVEGYGFRCSCRACCHRLATTAASTSTSTPTAMGAEKNGTDAESLPSSLSQPSNARDPLDLPQEYDFETMGTKPIDSIREIQFGLNDRLLELQRSSSSSSSSSCEQKTNTNTNETKIETDNQSETETTTNRTLAVLKESLEEVLAAIAMTRRGIRNQNLPMSHEVSIESDRLSAAACDLWSRRRCRRRRGTTAGTTSTTTTTTTTTTQEEPQPSTEPTTDSSSSPLGEGGSGPDHHRRFFRKVSEIRDLFDPVALGTQHLELASSIRLRSNELRSVNDNDYDTDNHGENDNNSDERDDKADAVLERERGMTLLVTALGRDHPWVRELAPQTSDDSGGDDDGDDDGNDDDNGQQTVRSRPCDEGGGDSSSSNDPASESRSDAKRQRLGPSSLS